MGKTSSVNVATPAFSNGTVSINGTKKADISKKGNSVDSNYNMNDYEKTVYDYAQKSLAQNLPNLNVFNDNVKKGLDSQLEAYKNQALNTLNSLYQPMIKNLTNDIASRFGNVDNSMFLDNLNSIENNRAKAMSDLVQDIQMYRNDLYNNELANRYNYLNLLNTLVNGSNNNALNYLSSALSNSNAGNAYNQSVANLLNSANRGGTSNSITNLNNLSTLASLIKYL